jgi:hypothetical protein
MYRYIACGLSFVLVLISLPDVVTITFAFNEEIYVLYVS